MSDPKSEAPGLNDFPKYHLADLAVGYYRLKKLNDQRDEMRRSLNSQGDPTEAGDSIEKNT